MLRDKSKPASDLDDFETTSMAEFVRFDYAETKDLSKTFLTVGSATLIFSVAFAERIIGMQPPLRYLLWLLFASWVLQFVALLGCASALRFMFSAAWIATRRSCNPGRFEGLGLFERRVTLAKRLWKASMASFALGVSVMIGAAFFRLSN